MSGQNDLSPGPILAAGAAAAAESLAPVGAASAAIGGPPEPGVAAETAATKDSRGGLRRYGGRGGEERRAERRERLLDAGLACYGEVGYHAATVRMICARAGLTERYFYESFANGEDLLCAVYLRHLELQRARIAGAMLAATGAMAGDAPAAAPADSAAPADAAARADAAAEAMLAAGLRAFLLLARENPAGARLQFVEVLGVSPRVDKLYRQAVEDFAQLLRQWNDELSASAGDLAVRGDPATLAVGLVGAAVGIGSRWLLSGFAQPLEVMLDTLLTLFRGVWLQARPAP